MTVRRREAVTSGSVNASHVRFEFSPDWAGMTRVAVFKAGAVSRCVLLDEANSCAIPWEVLGRHGVQLTAGVYGTRGGEVVMPTVWASLGIILEGVATGEDAQPPAPDLWGQKLAAKGDALGYTEAGELGLYAEGRLLSAVPKEPAYGVGHGLKVEDGELSVDSVDGFNGDNTLPMTAAGVQTVVGNIEALLGRI